MMTERQNAKEMAARAAHAVTRPMMVERQDAKETVARPAHAVMRLMTTEHHDTKELVTRTPQPTVPRLCTLMRVTGFAVLSSRPATF
jgi:hypothetical protein